jgi:hypothetical protein
MAKTFSASAREMGLVARARKQDVRAACTLLAELADALRDCKPLSHEAGNFLADALEDAIKEPSTAPVSLGLVRKDHRPAIDEETKFKAYIMATRLHERGWPLKGSRSKSGAWPTVAEQLGISEDSVAAIWKEFRRYERRLAQSTANVGVNSPEGY